jgi:hypothetical protein
MVEGKAVAFGNLDGDEPLFLLTLQNLPAMADQGCLLRRDADGIAVLVHADGADR